MPSSLSIHSSRASMNSFCSFVRSSSCIIRFKDLWCTYFPPAHQRLSERLLGLLIVFCYVSLTLLACACEHTPVCGVTPVHVLGVYQCADIPVGRVTANPCRYFAVHRCGHIDLALFHIDRVLMQHLQETTCARQKEQKKHNPKTVLLLVQRLFLA